MKKRAETHNNDVVQMYAGRLSIVIDADEVGFSFGLFEMSAFLI
jgi:hypothetical protein